MSEPDYPYPKKPLEPSKSNVTAPPPMPPPEPPTLPSPPYNTLKFVCSTCGKVFNTKEELTMHMETVHQSPKNKP
ncbi:MAG: C2H2-type zinc finger protein [Candidatus Bathyarchaeota archaeon]|nr:C2H2-type zinc finger protein [Candidatus Bathyarchaeota archaeon]